MRRRAFGICFSLPNPAERPQSSLGFMMLRVAERYGDGFEAWYLQNDTIDVDRFIADVQAATAEGAPVCLAGTAFAFVQLLDMLRERDRAIACASAAFAHHGNGRIQRPDASRQT